MAQSKSLKTAVKREVAQAKETVSTGNVATVKESPKTLAQVADLPTGTRRSHQP